MTMEFSFRGKRIRVMEEDMSSRRYQTVRYKEALEIIKKEDIRQLLVLEALEWFFHEDKRIPMNDKFAISEISYDYNARIIKIRSAEAHHIYENRNFIARKTGWYFYITGATLPQSELSILIDQISKRFDISDLKWN